MKLVRASKGLLSLELSEQELLTLRACMRETFAALEKEEFPLRIGISMDKALKIADELGALIRQASIEE